MTRMMRIKSQILKASWSMNMRKETMYGLHQSRRHQSTSMLPLQSLSDLPRLSRKTLRPGIMKSTSHHTSAISTQYSPRTPLMTYQNLNLGTTPLSSFQKLMPPRAVKSTLCLSQNKRNLTPSSKRTLTLVVSTHPSPPWPHWSSLSKRSAAVFGLFRTTSC